MSLPLIGFAQEKTKAETEEASINWMTIEEVQEAMKKEPRKIMMDVYTSWCGPCKLMMANTFTNNDLIDYVNKNYYAVKFNAESPEPVTFKGVTYENPDYVEGKKGRNGVHKFSRFLRVSAYPTVVYMDEELNILTVDVGYKEAQMMERILKFFNEDRHQVEDPQGAWNEYNAEFVPEFEK